MTSLDFLYITLAIGFITLTVFISMVLFQLMEAIREMRYVLGDVRNTTKDFVLMKDTVKVGVLEFVYKLLGGKRGERV